MGGSFTIQVDMTQTVFDSIEKVSTNLTVLWCGYIWTGEKVNVTQISSTRRNGTMIYLCVIDYISVLKIDSIYTV